MIALLLAAILLVIVCGGIFVYRALLAIVKLLEEISGKLDSLPEISGKLPSSRLLTTLLSLGGD